MESSVHVVTSSALAFVGIHANVTILSAVMYLALSLSSLSAILILSAETTVSFSVSIAGDSWLGNTDSFAPVAHVSVSANTSASVDISTLPATVSLAFGVAPFALITQAPPT